MPLVRYTDQNFLDFDSINWPQWPRNPDDCRIPEAELIKPQPWPFPLPVFFPFLGNHLHIGSKITISGTKKYMLVNRQAFSEQWSPVHVGLASAG